MSFKVGCLICVTYEETASQCSCFAHFCHNCVATVGAHMHTYLYPLFQSGTKKSLKRSRTFTYVNTKNNSKVDFSYNDTWCTAGYICQANKLMYVWKQLIR